MNQRRPGRTPVKAPSGLGLTRISDRLSFLYLDKCRIEQDDNGTHARIETESGSRSTYLPVATLACLLLGPGTSISSPAGAALAKHGCAVVFTGAGVVRSYSAISAISGSTRLLTKQARAHVDPRERVRVVKQMFGMRFPDGVLPPGPDLSLEVLRGLEGARMRAIYQSEARRRRLKSWKRRKDGDEPLDTVNLALNYANTALYGVCLAVVCGLGMSPGLGIVHEGNPRAFILDIADLYKTEVTIPLAFRQAASANPGPDVMKALRDEFRLLRLLPRIVNDIHRLFGEEEVADRWDINDLYLWSSTGDFIDSGHNQDRRAPGTR